MSTKEEWRPVAGYEGAYEVSNRGRVRSLDRPWHPGRILKPSMTRRYWSVVLFGVGKPKRMTIHRLVALSFIDNPERLPIVRHLDDNRDNNMVENLAWGTTKQNVQDSIRNGTHHEKNRTHCPKGHAYTLENTYLSRWKEKPGRVTRKCRECHKKSVYARRALKASVKHVDNERELT